MAGRTPSQAARNFVEPLQLAVSCVSKAVLRQRNEILPGSDTRGLAVAGDRAIRLSGQTPYSLDLSFQFRVVEDETPGWGPYRVTTLAYIYEFLDADEKRVLGFHWHPEISPQYGPHLHLGAGLGLERSPALKYHVPTGRLCLEEILRFLISQFHVRTIKGDWKEILARGQAAHEERRTWPTPLPRI